MRATGLIALLLLPACADNDGTTNSVDVSAAATRAESDIANYAAERAETRRPRSEPTATRTDEPAPPPASGGPVRANQGSKPL